jgi:hypothetical protein
MWAAARSPPEAKAEFEHMGEQAPLQAASIRQTARTFSIPPRALYSAVRANELTLCRTSGARSVLLFDDVKAWLRERPAPSRTRSKQQTEASHGLNP